MLEYGLETAVYLQLIFYCFILAEHNLILTLSI